MTALQDKIYGREIPTGIRKSQVVIGRGGSGNARKSVSSASTVSTVSTTSTTTSRFLGSLGSRGTAAGSRRWSSASGDFTSVINITQEVGDSDRYDLYTISSHSTSTNESGVLSDIPSFISEYTFKTSSNPSRPSTMSSNPSRRSGQSDWLARIPRTYSLESLPQTFSEPVEATVMIPISQNQPVFRDPFSNNSSRSLAVYPTRRHSEVAPFDEPFDDGASINDQQQHSPASKSPHRFKMFRKNGPRIDTQLTPPGAYPSSSRFGQSNETVNVRNASISSADNSPTNRRDSNSLARGLLLRVGSRGGN